MSKTEFTKDKIKRIRLEQGLTQKELAKKCNMYESQIRKYETGKANPKKETLEKIASALSVPVTALYSDSSILIQEIGQAAFSALSILEKDCEKESRLIKAYRSLNPKGQDKAIEQVEMLTKIPEYRKEESPDQEAPETDPKE